MIAVPANPPPVYVLVGSAVLVREALEDVRTGVCGGPTAAFNHAVFSAGDGDALAFADAACTLPMMAARRLVEIRQVQDANVALLDAILAYVQQPNPTTVLVLAGDRFPSAVGGVDRGARIQNAVRKIGVVHKLDGEGVDPVRFAIERGRALGVAIDRDAAAELASRAGGDLSIVAADVEKCAAFAGSGGRVDMETVGEVCVSVADADVWTLTDALVAGDRERALGTAHRLLEDGEHPAKLMGSVLWQLRQVLLVQDAQRRGIPEREAGVRMPPQKLRVVRERVQRRSIPPAALLEQLAAVGEASHSSRTGDRRIFEALILRLVTTA